MNRQKSRRIVENVLSGTKAGFKSTLNSQNLFERKKMDHQKSKSTVSATLLALILGLIVLWTGLAAVAAEKKYVTDPTTGKVVTAPAYGGTITFAKGVTATSADILAIGSSSEGLIDPVVEKLGMADWATPRDKFDFYSFSPPTYTKGALAESWSQPDPLTVIVKVRQGVHWHKKAPMNGRALTAQDIEYNYHRILGLGSGFTEPSKAAGYGALSGVNVESVTATDKYTVVFELQEPSLTVLTAIFNEFTGFIYPPEVIKKHGDMQDWRNLVGTGPFMLTHRTEGSSITWTKNPDYWGTDEKYPQNRLPYVERIRALVMPELATRLATLRTGQLDYLGVIGGGQIKSIDQVESLRKTNPDIVIWPLAFRSNNSIGMNVQAEPFDDIRVRKALQMALNLEEINNAFFKGYADIIPQGQLSRSISQALIPFEDWPEEIKKVFDYDPESAEALLDEAGFPRGADGVRFKTDFTQNASYDLNYIQLLASYWKKIGVDVEIDVPPIPGFVARRKSADFRLINAEAAGKTVPLGWAGGMRYTDVTWDSSNVDDPWYNAKFKEKEAATTMEEVNSITKELNQYAIENFWTLFGPIAPEYTVVQPWIIGYNGEVWLGENRYITVFSRLWIDSELKEAMGH